VGKDDRPRRGFPEGGSGDFDRVAVELDDGSSYEIRPGATFVGENYLNVFSEREPDGNSTP
jgi:hypothetical protein